MDFVISCDKMNQPHVGIGGKNLLSSVYSIGLATSIQITGQITKSLVKFIFMPLSFPSAL
jgi:hypothetical protein